MFKSFLLSILIILPIAANAHSPLSSSFPKDGETLNVPPVKIVMDFKLPAKLIKVELIKSKSNQRNSFLGGLFGGDAGEPVPLVEHARREPRLEYCRDDLLALGRGDGAEVVVDHGDGGGLRARRAPGGPG